jgi:zinc-ribbon domain
MIGTVLNFAKSGDGGSDSGVIRGEDGARYRFAASDWAAPGSAIAGDVVDFEIKDGVATEIYVTSRVATADIPLATTAPLFQAPAAPFPMADNNVNFSPPPKPVEISQTAMPASAPVTLPSGLGARFFITYFITLVPTYILPYLGSNSMVVNGVGADVGGFPLQFWWHFSAYGLLIFLAYVRGVRIARGWLVTFPILAMIFDLMPGLNFIPFVPSIFNFVVLYVGASRKAPDGYAPENLNAKIEYGLWGIAAFSAFAIYNIFRTPFSGNGGGGFAGSLLLWPVLGTAVFFALKYRAGEGAALFARISNSVSDDANDPMAAPVMSSPVPITVNVDDMQATYPMVASQFCHQCGARNTADDSFCIECGTKLEAA